MSSSYRIELDNWLRRLNVKAESVLDIGGSQLPVKGRTASWDVQHYAIADLPDPHVGSPKPDIEFDMNQAYVPFDKDRVDIVFCLEVFDYIWNPAQAFMNLAACLNPGGLAYASFPFMYPTHQPIEDDALRYAEAGIRKLAAHASLTVEELIPRRPESNGLEFLWRAERMRAAKHYDHNVTGWIAAFRKAV